MSTLFLFSLLLFCLSFAQPLEVSLCQAACGVSPCQTPFCNGGATLSVSSGVCYPVFNGTLVGSEIQSFQIKACTLGVTCKAGEAEIWGYSDSDCVTLAANYGEFVGDNCLAVALSFNLTTYTFGFSGFPVACTSTAQATTVPGATTTVPDATTTVFTVTTTPTSGPNKVGIIVGTIVAVAGSLFIVHYFFSLKQFFFFFFDTKISGRCNHRHRYCVHAKEKSRIQTHLNEPKKISFFSLFFDKNSTRKLLFLWL
jgi:hypothetical protein